MRRDVTERAEVECTLVQLLSCLGQLGLSDDELPSVLREVLESKHLRLVGGPHPWLSPDDGGPRVH